MIRRYRKMFLVSKENRTVTFITQNPHPSLQRDCMPSALVQRTKYTICTSCSSRERAELSTCLVVTHVSSFLLFYVMQRAIPLSSALIRVLSTTLEILACASLAILCSPLRVRYLCSPRSKLVREARDKKTISPFASFIHCRGAFPESC